MIGRNSMNFLNWLVYKEILANIHPLSFVLFFAAVSVKKIKMSDINVIPSNLVAIRKRQYEQRQDEWFSARWMQQNAEQSLEYAKEYTRVTTERKLQAERELEEAREEEYRQSRAGVIRTREGVFSNINMRQSLRQLSLTA